MHDAILSAVKPKEKVLKLKLSTRDFHVTHELDNTSQMEDLIDEMRPSFWPKKAKKPRYSQVIRELPDIPDAEDTNQKKRAEYISRLRQRLTDSLARSGASNRSSLDASHPSPLPQNIVDDSHYTMKEEEKGRPSRVVVRRIVNEWVQKNDDEHVPPVELANEDRTVLSHLEKGTFRLEVPPRPPFLLGASDMESRLTDEASASLHSPISAPASVPATSSPATPTPAPPSEVDPRDEKAILHAYLTKISTQPIRSYRAFYNATVEPPTEKRAKPTKLLEGSTYGEEVLKDRKHEFDHLRFKKQVEIEDFTRWRGKCRGVVSAALAASGDQKSLLDKQLAVYGVTERSKVPPILGAKRSVEGNYASVWTTKSMYLAIEEKKKHICSCIENFTLDFAAATLSKEAMESLRSDVLEAIRAKPCRSFNNALFSKQDFISFISVRNSHVAESRIPIFTGPIDVVDAMQSPAEAAFAKYVLKVLPT